MKAYYYSGLEGLCRSLSELSSPDKEYRTSEAVFARDVFHGADRFDKDYNVSRTWRLVPKRRAGKFVLAWVDPAREAAAKKALAACDRNACIPYEREALARCVEAMVGGAPEDAGEAPTALRDVLVALPSPVADLRNSVIPAVVDGFLTERYRPTTVRAFQRDMDQLLDRIVRLDEFGLRKLLARLVAAVVFGPGHRLALAADPVATADPYDDAMPIDAMQGARILLTQVYDDRFALVGASFEIGREGALFIGRSSDAEAYRARLRSCEGCGSVVEVVARLDAEIARIADDNAAVSNTHGVVFYNGVAWMYCDLESSNGSVLSNDDGDLLADPLRVLAPGDRLVLGTRAPRYDATDYCPAATLVVSERYEG